MPEIDEELGRYLDSLVEPVEPEWVIGWVARRRRRRAAAVAGGALVLAGLAGSLGYALHSPSPSSSVRFGTSASTDSDGSSTSSEAPTSTALPAPSTTVSVPATAPHSTAPAQTTVPPVTTAPPDVGPVYPWPVTKLEPGDVAASLDFPTTTPLSGDVENVTVTLVNQTQEGVVLIHEADFDLVLVVDGQIYLCDVPTLYMPPEPFFKKVLPPAATVSGTCRYRAGDPGPATATVDIEQEMVPLLAPFTQTPVQLEIGPAPTTTTTSTVPSG